MQRRSRRHHRIHRVFLLDVEINQHRPIVLSRRFHRRHYFGARTHRRCLDAIGFGELRKIRVQQRRCRVVALVEKFLPLPHHPEEAIVNDGNVDFQILLHDRRQLRHRHLKSAIANDHPDFRLRARDFHADRCGQSESHRAQSA